MGDGSHYPKVEIHALARPTKPGHIRMWIGVFDQDAPARLTWTINTPSEGHPAAQFEVPSEAIRSLTPMPPGPPSVLTQTGLYDLPIPLRSNQRTAPEYTVRADVDWADGRHERSAALAVRPLPDEVPRGLHASFKVMLVSCFYENADSVGKVGALARMLSQGLDRPDLVLTVGDQVYLDNPILGSIKRSEESFAKLFERKYRKNWQTAPGSTGYADILRAAPVAGIPDDHEFWNNYPAPGWVWPSTWGGDSCDNWEKAARNAFDAFQHGDDASDPSSYCYNFDVAPLSFFMLDSRTFRTGTIDHMHGMQPEHLDAYTDWVQRMLDTPQSIPVLVTGPSLFQEAKTSRRSFDLNFANVREYPTIMTGLLRLSRAGRTPLALTGDVHYPRVVRATYRPGSRSRPWSPIYEVIASPASLVALQRQSATKPDKSDTFTLDTQADMSLSCRKHWPPTGHALVHDHVAIVKFVRTNAGLRVKVRYWLVPHAGKTPRYYDTPPFALTYAAEASTIQAWNQSSAMLDALTDESTSQILEAP